MKNLNELFNEKELNKLGFSEEEIEILGDAEAYVDTIDLIPDDIDKFMDKLEKTFPNDYKNADATIEKMDKVAQKDPEFMKQLIALVFAYNDVKEEQAPAVEKVSLTEINKVNDEVKNEELDSMITDFIRDFKKLTPAEKADLMNRLKK